MTVLLWILAVIGGLCLLPIAFELLVYTAIGLFALCVMVLAIIAKLIRGREGAE